MWLTTTTTVGSLVCCGNSNSQIHRPRPAGLVVDAACGTGRYAAHLAARGRDVVGVDIAAEMLAIAEARVPTGRFVVGDLCALPLATASMTGAVSG